MEYKVSDTPLKDLLFKNFERHLGQYYGLAARIASRSGTGLLPIELDWIEADKSLRILSEHATPSHWCDVTLTLRTYLDGYDRQASDLVGIIVIYGTDTMAYAVAAVQFAIRTQRIPIVFVGSNYPLRQDRHQERRLSQLKSDAWPNLLNAVGYCILCKGIAPQVVLSFGNAILYALNLRKLHESAVTTIDATPPPPVPPRDPPLESYLFHNVLSRRKYLAWFSRGQFLYDDHEDISSVPFPAATDSAPIEFYPDVYAKPDTVVEVAAAPCVALPDRSVISKCRAVLVETYLSGTMPADQRDHSFWTLLALCAENKVPVFLAGKYGINMRQRYRSTRVDELMGASKDGRALSIYRISNIVAESALPLLVLACEEAGKTATTASPEHRGELIRVEMGRRLRRLQDITRQFEVETAIRSLNQ